jgi:DNA (cytosine-5)-methyltransferase 1
MSANPDAADRNAAVNADSGARIRVTRRRGPVLSIFPGIGLLDRGFEMEGWCVVRGPDTIWGGDIRAFHPPGATFEGIVGGPPCQDFSSLRRCPPTGLGLEMLAQFARCVTEAGPLWFIMENVVGVPDLKIPGYHVQRLNLAASECGSTQRRLRCIQFGQMEHAKPGGAKYWPLVIPRPPAGSGTSQPALASEGNRAGRRTWADFCELQGLPRDFDLPGVSRSAKYRAVGNGVPIQMGRTLAHAVTTWCVTETPTRACICGCGRPVTTTKIQATAACRKRMERNRRDAAVVTGPGVVTPAPSQDMLSLV